MPDKPAPEPPPPPKKPRKWKQLPEELARDAIAHEEIVTGGRVRMTSRVLLDRMDAQALAARAIREEKNVVTLLAEILTAAAKDKT